MGPSKGILKLREFEVRLALTGFPASACGPTYRGDARLVRHILTSKYPLGAQPANTRSFFRSTGPSRLRTTRRASAGHAMDHVEARVSWQNKLWMRSHTRALTLSLSREQDRVWLAHGAVLG